MNPVTIPVTVPAPRFLHTVSCTPFPAHPTQPNDLDYYHLGEAQAYILCSYRDEPPQCSYVNNVPQFPLMPPSRYPLRAEQKKVEMLRIRDDRKGFSGNAVKVRGFLRNKCGKELSALAFSFVMLMGQCKI